MANPLTQVTDALWTLLEANTSFTDLVRAENRIKYDNRDPEKDEVAYSDYPLVRIRESSTHAHPRRASNMTTFAKQYHIQIATGEQSYVSIHNVEWEIIRAFADWTTHLEALEWDVDASNFVKDCQLLTAEQVLDDQKLNRGIRGWSTVWGCLVLFAFQRTALKPS
ncbi:MAG: hypothetical protein U9Q82_11260 [Chloroflexota bacterium]|nr:hypothetical protein [Chloroflexota bacterium]